LEKGELKNFCNLILITAEPHSYYCCCCYLES